MTQDPLTPNQSFLMSFHQFIDSQGNQFGSFKVFKYELYEELHPFADCIPAGWYWQACFPGCIPDSDPNGPFKSEDDAITDANS